MTNITPELKKILKKAVAAAGSQNKFAQMLGVPNTTVRKWLADTDKPHGIQDGLFMRILPFLEEFMSAEDFVLWSSCASAGNRASSRYGNAIAGRNVTIHNNSCADEIEIFRRSVLDALMASTLEPKAKDAAYQIVLKIDVGKK